MSVDRLELRQNGQRYIGGVPEQAVVTLEQFQVRRRGNASDVFSD